MDETTRDTIIFNGLGFPIRLVNVPMKKRFGEWTLDINIEKLQRRVLHELAHKKTPLTGDELCFIRKYLEMTTTTFGKTFGVTHAAVLKWEADKAKINTGTELWIRFHIIDYLLLNTRVLPHGEK